MPELSLTLVLHAYRAVKPKTHRRWCHDLLMLAPHYRIVLDYEDNDALVSRSRSKLLSRFVDEHDTDVTVWIDADIVWRPPSLPAAGGRGRATW